MAKKIPNRENLSVWEKKIDRNVIIAIFVLAFLARFLTFGESHTVDINMIKWWTGRLSNFSEFNNFYTSGTHCVYGPGYMYLLSISGHLANLFKVTAENPAFEVFIKMWGLIAETLGAFVIYKIGKQQRQQLMGIIVGIVYMFLPAIILNSTYWGQFDSILGTLLLCSVYFFYRGKKIPAGIIYVYAVMTKPQAIFIAPLVLYVYFLKDYKFKKQETPYFTKEYWKETIIGGFTTVGSYILFLLPISIPAVINLEKNPAVGGFGIEEVGRTILFSTPFHWFIDLIMWFPRHTIIYAQDYNYGSANGFNFWYAIGKQIVGVDEPFWGKTIEFWSTIFVVLICIFAICMLVKFKANAYSIFGCSFLLMFGWFMFYTKIHERYLVGSIIFAAVCIFWDKLAIIPFIVVSTITFYNQYFLYESSKLEHYWLSPGDPVVAQDYHTGVIFSILLLLTFFLVCLRLATVSVEKSENRSLILGGKNEK